MLQELQESAPWNLNEIREPSASDKVYFLFLAIVCLLTVIKLIKIWWMTPPFKLPREESRSTYVTALQTASCSLIRWSQCIFLCWGILSAAALYSLCDEMLYERHTGITVIVAATQDFSVGLGITLFAALFIFLVRWHLLARIARLGTELSAGGDQTTMPR